MRISPLIFAIVTALSAAEPLAAQEHPVRRVANIVNVAVEEYARGVDSRGQLISAIEYQEATDFLADARTQAARLSGPRAQAALAVLDSIVGGVARRQPPAEVKALELRFAAAL